jgi:hypothetical protein
VNISEGVEQEKRKIKMRELRKEDIFTSKELESRNV